MDTIEYTNIEIIKHLEATGFVHSPARVRAIVKQASNQLARTHHMGLLKRRRVKRICCSETGKQFFRGFKYLNSISRQGQDYGSYREKSARSTSETLGPEDTGSAVAPNDYRRIGLWLGSNVFSSISPLKGRYRRFPPRIDSGTRIFISNLISESEQKDRLIANLRDEIEDLEFGLNMVVRQNQESKRTLDSTK